MNVVVDTSVWSLALRCNTPNDVISIVNKLRSLITNEQVVLLGVIRQKVLSGIRYQEQFIRLREYLRAFSDLQLTTEDYELGAEFFNTCRSHGIQGSNTYFLICAVAHHRGYSIFTTDKDFDNFRLYIPVVLY
ncbi:PIN domain-containing protein [Dapis sp. BLCC M229]|uniref:PIN domain-containing protein n=1 Tax=Dapis sp. BLCC M229 TaxID=3400188 RepID=UPI003CF872C0